jgi:hypothetical protein
MLLIQLTLFSGSLSARSEVQAIWHRCFNIMVTEERHYSICARSCVRVPRNVTALTSLMKFVNVQECSGMFRNDSSADAHNLVGMKQGIARVRFEVFTAVTMKNAVFWDVTPCGSCKNRRFGGTWRLLHQGDKNRRTRNNTSCN